MQDLALDPGVRLVHIGPPKTGTTTVQGAFHLARRRLAERGVVYAGAGRQPRWAALAVTGKKAPVGMRPANMADWTSLVDEVAAAGDQRVVVSSEFFADGDDDAARQVVAELGGPRAHVVVTLRPLHRILVSQWQQYVQSGVRAPYEEWLDAKFNKPPYSRPTPSFWQRHRHDQLVERWASAAGTENLTVVVVDESDPRMLIDSFESLLDLPAGFLVPERGLTNRSLTLGETELFRLLNVEFRRQGWPEEVYDKLLRHGAAMRMKSAHQPLPSEPKITTPRWAREQAAAIGAEAAAKIESMGVRIVGDVFSLGQMPADPPEPSDDQAQPPSVSAAAAAQAILGTITASGVLADPTPPPSRTRDKSVRDVDARSLARVLRNRVRRRIRRAVRRR